MTISVKSDPTPGHFYRAKNGDTWLGLVGRAYGVRAGKTRLKMSQMANLQPANWRLHRAARGSFERRYYTDGLVKLARHFPCKDLDFKRHTGDFLDRGSCRPLIYIPPREDVWFPPPPEVPQVSHILCWAAAISSLSQSRDLAHFFSTKERALARLLFVKIDQGGESVPIVSEETHGLRYIPPRGRTPRAGIPLARGEMTMVRLAEFLDLDLAVHFGDARPGKVQRKRGDTKLTLADLRIYLESAGGPILLVKVPRKKDDEIGHVTVVFGVSEEDQFYMEMDPFGHPSSGPVFGPLNTIGAREERLLTRNLGDTGPTREIYVLF